MKKYTKPFAVNGTHFRHKVEQLEDGRFRVTLQASPNHGEPNYYWVDRKVATVTKEVAQEYLPEFTL